MNNLPTPTLAHLANTGKALLLVPVEPPAELAQENLYLALDNLEPHQLWYWAGDAGDEASDAICRPHPPHAPGDVIQIPFEVDDPTCVLACRPARVIEVLPPVRVKQLTAQELAAIAVYRDIIPKSGDHPDLECWVTGPPPAHAHPTPEEAVRELYPDLSPGTYVWRVKLEAATAAGGKT